MIGQLEVNRITYLPLFPTISCESADNISVPSCPMEIDYKKLFTVDGTLCGYRACFRFFCLFFCLFACNEFQWSLEKCGKLMCSVHHLSTHSCPPCLLERSLIPDTSAPCSVTLGKRMVLAEFLLLLCTQTYLSPILVVF